MEYVHRSCVRCPCPHPVISPERVLPYQPLTYVPVRDYERGAALLGLQVLERRLHLALVLVVQRGGGLVQQQNLGVGDAGAGDRDALFLVIGFMCKKRFIITAIYASSCNQRESE